MDWISCQCDLHFKIFFVSVKPWFENYFFSSFLISVQVIVIARKFGCDV